MQLTAGLVKVLEEEAEDTLQSVASLVRHILRWHRRLERNRDESKPKRRPDPELTDKVVKGIKIDPEDLEHLEAVAVASGFTRTTALVLVIHQYFGIPLVPRP